MSREKPEPKWTHDCERCVFLGQVRQRRDSDPIYDVYWCKSGRGGRASSPNLDSVIGRYGDEGSEYASSHPPLCFAGPQEALAIADRWYLYALVQAAVRGLWKPDLTVVPDPDLLDLLEDC